MKQNKAKIYRALSIVFALIFIACIIWLITYFVGLKKAEKQMQDITDKYITETSVAPSESSSEEPSKSSEVIEPSETEPETEPEPEVNLEEYGVTDRVIDFDALHAEVNADIYSWIVVPGTVIDYPVLQSADQMDYYLEHNLDGSKGYPGCIYTQRMNKKDWTDKNTVLYGHNMKNGTMFAGLHKFKDRSFFDENRYIYIYTEDGRILVYEIFGAYEFADSHLLMTFNLDTDESFMNYIDIVKSCDAFTDHFADDIEITAESKIITLSTCISNKPNRRYLVQGVLVAEGEQPCAE